MHGQDAAGGEVECVDGGEIGVVIAGQKGCLRRLARKKIEHFGLKFKRAVRGGARPGVEGIAVEHELCDPVQERPKLGEPVDAARPVAKMDVGEDAGDFGRHGSIYSGGL